MVALLLYPHSKSGHAKFLYKRPVFLMILSFSGLTFTCHSASSPPKPYTITDLFIRSFFSSAQHVFRSLRQHRRQGQRSCLHFQRSHSVCNDKDCLSFINLIPFRISVSLSTSRDAAPSSNRQPALF